MKIKWDKQGKEHCQQVMHRYLKNNQKYSTAKFKTPAITAVAIRYCDNSVTHYKVFIADNEAVLDVTKAVAGAVGFDYYEGRDSEFISIGGGGYCKVQHIAEELRRALDYPKEIRYYR